MAYAPDAIPLSLEIQAGVSPWSRKKGVWDTRPVPLGSGSTTLFLREDSMKKIGSNLRVTRGARRKAARRAAPRFQSRRRQRPLTTYPHRLPGQLPARKRNPSAQEEVMTAGMLRMPALRGQYPRSRSTIYGDIRAGRFTPPVALGPRCSAWPAREVDQIIAAHAAGASDREIRQLVARLVAERAGR